MEFIIRFYVDACFSFQILWTNQCSNVVHGSPLEDLASVQPIHTFAFVCFFDGISRTNLELLCMSRRFISSCSIVCFRRYIIDLFVLISVLCSYLLLSSLIDDDSGSVAIQSCITWVNFVTEAMHSFCNCFCIE